MSDIDTSRNALRRAKQIAALLLLASAACGPGQVGSSGGETSDGETTTLDDSSESDSSESDSSEDDPSGSEMDDPDPSTTGLVPFDDLCFKFWCSTCDVFQQDCPRGEKCTPYASSGGTWDAPKCVPLFGDLEPGEPCTYDGRVEATDDCDETSMCYDGTCQRYCTGTADDPMCPVGLGCASERHGDPFALCLPLCDPLLQDCSPGSCYWRNEQFLCNPSGEVGVGEPCGFVNDCAGGSACIDAELIPDCLGAACCSPLCKLDEPYCESLPGSECVAWFEPGQAPAGLELVGVCLSL